MSEKLAQDVADLGGESLTGSGFEDESPDTEFGTDNNDAEEVARPA